MTIKQLLLIKYIAENFVKTYVHLFKNENNELIVELYVGKEKNKPCEYAMKLNLSKNIIEWIRDDLKEIVNKFENELKKIFESF